MKKINYIILLMLVVPCMASAMPPMPLVFSKIIYSSIVDRLPLMGPVLGESFILGINFVSEENNGTTMYFNIKTERPSLTGEIIGCAAKLKLTVGKKTLPNGAVAEIPEVKEVYVVNSVCDNTAPRYK